MLYNGYMDRNFNANDIFEELEQMEPDLQMSSAAFDSVCGKLGIGRRSRRSRFAHAVAGVAAALFVPAALAAVWLGLRQHPDAVWTEISVGAAQTREVLLSDGTSLTLKPGTRLTYPSHFTGRERQVFVDGQMTAEVAKDADHPFVITSGDVTVRVLGTRFELKSYSEDSNVEVLLLNGSVSLGIPSGDGRREVTMTPGDMVQYDKVSGVTDISRYSEDMAESLGGGSVICFNNLRLSDIASDLERRFGAQIVLSDPDIAGSRYFAIFKHGEKLPDIFSALSRNSNMQWEQRGGVFYITAKH